MSIWEFDLIKLELDVAVEFPVEEEEDVWSLRWFINSSPLGNLFPQKSEPLIQLHTKEGWVSWFGLGTKGGNPVFVNEGTPEGEYIYGGCLVEPAAAIKDAYWCAFLNTVVGHVESLQRGSEHGLLAANSAIMLMLGIVGGDANDAYADTEFCGITDGNVLVAIEECDECGKEDSLLMGFTADFLGVVFPSWGDWFFAKV